MGLMNNDPSSFPNHTAEMAPAPLEMRWETYFAIEKQADIK
jgi:hypothetical protein